MPSIFNSTLNKVNSTKKLNILTIPRKETFTFNLCKTGHNIYIMVQDNKDWNLAIRPLPKGSEIFGMHALNRKDLYIDLILCQDRAAHYSILSDVARKMGCPLICVQNWLAPPGANQFVLEHLADQIYNLNIFNSDFTANSWGLTESDENVSIIPNGIDTDLFCGWNGSDDKPLCVVRNYHDKSRGLEYLKAICDGMQVRIIGDSQGVSNPIPFDKLLASYQSAPVFVNTSQWVSCPVSLLEAMSTGCPVVTTGTTVLPSIIKNGTNGFVSNNPQELNSHIKNLVKDKDMAREIGSNGRKTIIEQFGIKSFIDNWNKVFQKVSDQPCCMITGNGDVL